MVDQASLFAASSALELAIIVGVGLITLSHPRYGSLGDIVWPARSLRARHETWQSTAVSSLQALGPVLPAACSLDLGTKKLRAAVDRAIRPDMKGTA